METRREVLEKYKESVDELANDLTGRIEELVAEVKKLIWGINHYNVNEKILERYRTDENGSSKDTTGDNNNS